MDEDELVQSQIKPPGSPISFQHQCVNPFGAEMCLSYRQAGLLDDVPDKQRERDVEGGRLRRKRGSVARNKLLGLHNRDRFLKMLLWVGSRVSVPHSLSLISNLPFCLAPGSH